jgi:hypothetical protein
MRPQLCHEQAICIGRLQIEHESVCRVLGPRRYAPYMPRRVRGFPWSRALSPSLSEAGPGRGALNIGLEMTPASILRKLLLKQLEHIVSSAAIGSFDSSDIPAKEPTRHRFKGRQFAPEIIVSMRPLVLAVSTQLAATGRDHGRTEPPSIT